MSIGSLGSDLRSDIARILAASPDTLDYTVIERCTEAGEQRLVAYVVPAQPVTSRGSGTRSPPARLRRRSTWCWSRACPAPPAVRRTSGAWRCYRCSTK
ncbi:hypothetical protein BZL30_4396 [Mycobacterium kansasii]|uniref:Uncharacterized protein n=1 Tax=Mycobacterium kansasii TaxID=1768 RepID=A0A1V3X2R1_MYCKA|nr:hypothetical protein BZL30_4396 [Mycobacterium kansasii]